VRERLYADEKRAENREASAALGGEMPAIERPPEDGGAFVVLGSGRLVEGAAS
jgi:hypothetical protein